MPDFDLDEIRERQAAARAEAVPADVDTSHLTKAAIAACGLCDDDGYNDAGQVCDHRPHSTPEGRQAAREALRAALTKDGKR